MKVKVEKSMAEQIADIKNRATRSKERSVFDGGCEGEETCYLLDGEVTVTTDDGSVVAFGEGDLVTFPKGLECVWDVRKSVRKHYRLD